MNNDIEEDYVSFEIAKLLKEKGFDCETNDKYTLMYPNGIQVGMEFHSKDFDNELVRTFIKVKMPTQSLAIKWIRENYQLDITTMLNKNNNIRYDYFIEKIEESNKVETLGPKEYLNFLSAQEATEEALLYTLQNLIEL